MNKDEKLSIVTDDGEEIVTILFTFEENGKNYVVFEFDDSKEVSAAIYVPGKDDSEGELQDLPESDWDLVDKVFDQYQKDLEDEEEVLEDDIN